MKIAVSSDHASFELKEKVKKHLESTGHEVTDFGCNSEESCDYPDYAAPAARAVAAGDVDYGVIMCGSGQGATMVANKIKGIRAALCRTIDDVIGTREHNNANVLTLGARITDHTTALALVDTFLKTPFPGDERHQRRIDKVNRL